jgi:hypothetical protein
MLDYLSVGRDRIPNLRAIRRAQGGAPDGVDLVLSGCVLERLEGEEEFFEEVGGDGGAVVCGAADVVDGS